MIFDFTRHYPSGWYPGHMRIAQQQLKEKLPLVDVVLLLTDARCPESALNSQLIELLGDKPFLLGLNKADLADPESTKTWLAELAKQGVPAITTELMKRRGVDRIVPECRRIYEEDRDRKGATRPLLRALRLMACGAPNLGKSTLINCLSRKSLARTGPTPGVTKSQQWIKLDADCELLDTPGIFPAGNPGAERELRLGLAHVVRQDLVGNATIARYLMAQLILRGQEKPLLEFSQLDALPEQPETLFATIAKRRGFILHGGEPDLERAELLLLTEFTEGRFGRLTLDPPPGSPPFPGADKVEILFQDLAPKPKPKPKPKKVYKPKAPPPPKTKGR